MRKNTLFSSFLFAAALVSLPALAAGVSTDRVLETPTGKLFGTELRPAGEGAAPMVLLHAGSGPTDRDGNTRPLGVVSDSLKLLAEALADQGIASLRFDKRGIAQSVAARPAPEATTIGLFADDAAAWVAQLRQDKRNSVVVFAGQSEGALVGLLAMQRTPADGFISIAGAARRLDDVLRIQLQPKLPPDLYAQSDRIMQALAKGEKVADVPQSLAPLYHASVQPFLISVFRVTPTDEIKKLKMPILLVQGTTDIQVGEDEARLFAAARPDAQLKIIAGMNHVLKEASSDMVQQQRAYTDPSLPLKKEAADAIAAFVHGLRGPR